MKWSFAVAALLMAAPVAAQQASLPAAGAAMAAIDSHPVVAAASARVRAARARSGMMRRGDHEVSVNSSWSRRDIDREGRYNEFETIVSRQFRLPGKAALDRRAGELDLLTAEDRYGDARHETSLLLATLWYDWVAAAAQNCNERAILEALEKAVTAVRRRAEVRDASRLDLDLAEAARAQASAQAASAAAAEAQARILLAATFPELPLPVQPPVLSEPVLPATVLSELRARVIAHSHEIAAATNEADRLATVADRARRDRIADPAVGIRLFSERGGIEKGVGLVVSMPLGGSYRRLRADEAAANASAARMEQQVVERSIEAIARADESNARLQLAAWREMADAGSNTREALHKTERGYELGQVDLSDLLYARRQLGEVERSEIETRANAWRAIVRLQIDSHMLWTIEDE